MRANVSESTERDKNLKIDNLRQEKIISNLLSRWIDENEINDIINFFEHVSATFSYYREEAWAFPNAKPFIYWRKEIQDDIESYTYLLNNWQLFFDGWITFSDFVLQAHRILFQTKSKHSRSNSFPVKSWIFRDKFVFLTRSSRDRDIHERLERSDFIPPNYSDIQNWLEKVEKIIRDDSIELFRKAALLHFRFATLHPFDDWNWRISRSLSISLLEHYWFKGARLFSTVAQCFMAHSKPQSL